MAEPASDKTLTLETFLPYRLSYTANLVSEMVAGAYRTLFDLSIPEWRIIAWVAEQEPTTQQAIGLKTRMDKVTVSRAAIALTKRGLLDRVPNPDDKRSQWLALSAEGRRLYEAVAPKALELERRITDRLSEKELATLDRLLRKIDALFV